MVCQRTASDCVLRYHIVPEAQTVVTSTSTMWADTSCPGGGPPPAPSAPGCCHRGLTDALVRRVSFLHAYRITSSYLITGIVYFMAFFIFLLGAICQSAWKSD